MIKFEDILFYPNMMRKNILTILTFLLSIKTWACPTPTELKYIFMKNDWIDAVPVNYILERHAMEYVYIVGRESRQQTKVFLLTHIEGQEMEDILQKVPNYMNDLILLTPHPIPFKFMSDASFDVCSYEVSQHPEIKGSFFMAGSMEEKTTLLRSLHSQK
jgi:hypothetical protein